MRIVLICREQIVKTYASRYLQSQHKFKTMRMSDGITRLHKIFYWQDAKYKRVSWQERVRWYDALYKLDVNFFVNWIEYKISKSVKEDIVISDVRYTNELIKLKDDLGFKVVRIAVPRTGMIKPMVALGKEHSAGTVLLRELFGNFDDIGVDYSIYSESYQDMKKGLDELVDKGRNNLL